MLNHRNVYIGASFAFQNISIDLQSNRNESWGGLKMNMSKSLFFVFLMSVVSMLLASVSLAAPPTLSVSGIPANIVAGSSFDVTVTATAVSAGQAINTVSLSNSQSWPVSPGTSQTCAAGSTSCVAKFTVSVPATAATGQVSILTVQSVASNGESAAPATASVTVSGAPVVGNVPPVKVNAVEIDGFELTTGDNNVRDLERGKSFELKVEMTANSAAKNVEVRAFVSGFEFSQTEPISDSTSPFDVEAGVSYVKTLTLKLPERADEDKYRIRLVIAGRDTEDITLNYRIKITPTDHEVVIRDLSVTPQTVQPGRGAVVATVRIKNLGNKDENDVKITVSIPELGITAEPGPEYINSLDSEESATSEEFFLRIDKCVKPGTYDVKADVTFEEGDKTVSARQPLTVTKGACEAAATGVVSGGNVKVYAPEQQSVNAGASASYSIVIKNDADTTKVLMLSSAGADWAILRFSPGSVVTVRPGETQTVNAVVSVNRDAGEGAHDLVVRVKAQDDQVVREISLAADVVSAKGAAAAGVSVENLVRWLQVGLLALIGVLVIVGLVVAFRKMKGPKEGEEGTQTYY